MKNMKVLLVALAILSIPLAFAQKASAQAPEIDSTDHVSILGYSSGTIYVYGENLSSPGSVVWWDDEENGPGTDVFFSIDSISDDGTTMILSYTAYVSGPELGSVYVTNNDGAAWSPDITIEPY